MASDTRSSGGHPHGRHWCSCPHQGLGWLRLWSEDWAPGCRKGMRQPLVLERFRDRQITNTNTCGWAVFSHVDFLFRDAHADRTNTNTTALVGWNLQHFFYFLFLFWALSDCLDKTQKCTNTCGMPLYMCLYLKAVLLDGVECLSTLRTIFSVSWS